MEWQPIETAPRVPKNSACGTSGPYILLSNSDGAWIGCHCPVFTSGYKPENPWNPVMLNRWHMGKGASSVPSHWMPLPEPPE